MKLIVFEIITWLINLHVMFGFGFFGEFSFQFKLHLNLNESGNWISEVPMKFVIS